MNFYFVAGLWGRMLWYLGLLTLVPMLYALGEGRAFWGLAFTALLSLGSGYLLCHHYARAKGIRINVREGALFLTGALGLLCTLGTIPYLFSGISWDKALFESVSGFTTTGLTVLGDLRLIPRSILLWRSLTQWVGGLGILLVLTVLLPRFTAEGQLLFSGDLYGSTLEVFVPRQQAMRKLVVSCFGALTALTTVLLLCAGLTEFDAVNQALTICSSGGFSVHNEGIRYYGSTFVIVIVFILSLVLCINRVLLLRCYKEGPKVLLADSEFKFFCSLVLVFTILIGVSLERNEHWFLADAFGIAFFHVISALSGTGFNLSAVSVWPDFARFCQLLLLIVGGCSGTNAAGLKFTRLSVMGKIALRELRHILHPKMVDDIKMSGRAVSTERISSVTKFIFLYALLLYCFSTMLALCEGSSLFEGVQLAASCLSNVGPVFVTRAPDGVVSVTTTAGRLLAIGAMFIGRLEIITVLLLGVPRFWQGR